MKKRDKHDREVARAAKEYVRRGYAVAADIPGWPKPPITNGRRADVFATRGRGTVMVEVEHFDTLDTSHTRKQVADLDRYCASARRCRLELRLT